MQEASQLRILEAQVPRTNRNLRFVHNDSGRLLCCYDPLTINSSIPMGNIMCFIILYFLFIGWPLFS